MIPFRAIKIPLDYRVQPSVGWVTADGDWVPDDAEEDVIGVSIPLRQTTDTPTIPPNLANPPIKRVVEE